MIKKIIKYSLVVLIGFIVLAILTPEPKVIYEEKDCSIQEVKITEQKKDIVKLKKVIELDNEAFLLTGDFMSDLDYWMNNPFEAEHQLSIWNNRINKIADEKWGIMKTIK